MVTHHPVCWEKLNFQLTWEEKHSSAVDISWTDLA